jgi:ADP-ribosylglycohydrolase
MLPSKDQYLGCVLGLALGDTLGAPYEGGPIERTLWRWLGYTADGIMRWTDDTQMALDLAESLLAKNALDQEDIALRFATSYSWRRGYGPGTAQLLKRIRRGQPWQSANKSIYPNGSFGNGAAMRASILALFFIQDLESLIHAAQHSAIITHAHPLGIEGCILIAVATRELLNKTPALQALKNLTLYCQSIELQNRLSSVQKWILEDVKPSPLQVKKQLGNGITAPSSCISALYIALRHLQSEFNELMNFTIACGGDVDTIGAMAGTLWGAYNGHTKLPTIPIDQRPRLELVAEQLYARAQSL